MPTSSPFVADDRSDDYFQNHSNAVRWPFSIYHKPIENDLAAALAAGRRRSLELKVLVFGCGLFHEAPLFRSVPRLTLVDMDTRLAPALKERIGDRAGLALFFPQTPAELLAIDAEESFDLVVCKEVIEHINQAGAYLAVLRRLLKPGGELWLSTPNYGDLPLPLIESTLLELVARRQGFSRRHIHPNKYSIERLRAELQSAGFTDVAISKTPWKLALCARARR